MFRHRLELLTRIFGSWLCLALTIEAPALAGDPRPPAPEEESVVLPPAYDDAALERFWNDAEEILGSRLGYTAETRQDGDSVTLAIGAVAMSDRDRRRLRRAVPGRWVDLEMFTTRYSLTDLQEFGTRAETALHDAGLQRVWVGYSTAPLGRPDLLEIYLDRDNARAREVLRNELPDGLFTIEVGRGRALGRRSTDFVDDWPFRFGIGALIMSCAIAAAVGRRRRIAAPSTN
jgi:hypothetical protein